MPLRGPRYSEAEAREAIAASLSYTDALRRLGMRPAGGNHRTLRRYAEEIWRIPVDHFDPDAVRRGRLYRDPSRSRRSSWRARATSAPASRSGSSMRG